MIWCADIFPITADFNYHPVPHRPLFKDGEGRRELGKKGSRKWVWEEKGQETEYLEGSLWGSDGVGDRTCCPSVYVSVKGIMPYLSHFSSAVEGFYSWIEDIFAGWICQLTGRSTCTNKPLILTDSSGDSASFYEAGSSAGQLVELV